VLALLASLATAWAMNEVLALSGASREAAEGVTMLVAAAVLAYVSHWLFARREAQRWQGYIKEQIGRALSGGQVFSLGFAAFLAVYREGAETVLFYQALAGAAPGQSAAIAAGFAVAAAGLVLVYWVIRKASMKLPLGPFFAGTAILLYALAVVFAGGGVLELQGARLIPATPLAGIPSIPLLGLFPTVESVVAQMVLLAALLPVLALWAAKRRRAAP
jgi:high-affinity iron transporter